MWKPGSMGHERGWHYGQAHDHMRAMREHEHEWHWREEDDNPITSFLNSFAEKMGEKAAEAITGQKSEE